MDQDQDSVVQRILAAVEAANADDARRAEEEAQSSAAEPPVDHHVELVGTPPNETIETAIEPTSAAEEPTEVGDPVHVDLVTPGAHVAASLTAVSPTAGRGIRTPYVAAPTSPVGSRDELDHPQWHSVRARIQDAVRESIEIEGPIALNRLVRNVVHRFGFDRAAAKRQEVVRQLVPEDLIYEDELGAFVWPSDLDREEWTGFRTTPSGFFRPLDEVAGEEIINALVHAARNGVYDHEQLMRDTLSYFDQYETHEAVCRPVGAVHLEGRAIGKARQAGCGLCLSHVAIERQQPFPQ